MQRRLRTSQQQHLIKISCQNTVLKPAPRPSPKALQENTHTDISETTRRPRPKTPQEKAPTKDPSGPSSASSACKARGSCTTNPHSFTHTNQHDSSCPLRKHAAIWTGDTLIFSSTRTSVKNLQTPCITGTTCTKRNPGYSAARNRARNCSRSTFKATRASKPVLRK